MSNAHFSVDSPRTLQLMRHVASGDNGLPLSYWPPDGTSEAARSLNKDKLHDSELYSSAEHGEEACEDGSSSLHMSQSDFPVHHFHQDEDQAGREHEDAGDVGSGVGDVGDVDEKQGPEEGQQESPEDLELDEDQVFFKQLQTLRRENEEKLGDLEKRYWDTVDNEYVNAWRTTPDAIPPPPHHNHHHRPASAPGVSTSRAMLKQYRVEAARDLVEALKRDQGLAGTQSYPEMATRIVARQRPCSASERGSGAARGRGRVSAVASVEEHEAAIEHVKNNIPAVDGFDLDQWAERIRAGVRRDHQRQVDGQSRGLTVPKPFSFDGRSIKTTARIRFERELALKAAEEEQMRRHQFVANPVPVATLLPRYNEIRQEQERRREEIKETSREQLAAAEKPFSFYLRDKARWEQKRRDADTAAEREAKRLQEEHRFAATPIPASLSAPVMQEIAAKEKQRKDRINNRAQRLLKKSSLPPRMEMWKEKEQKKAVHDDGPSFRPRINTTIPNFARLQASFEASLQRRRKERKTTVPRGFALETDRIPSKKPAIRAQIEEEERRKRQQALPQATMPPGASYAKPKHAPRTTHAAELRAQAVQQRTKAAEEKAKQEAAHKRAILAKRRQMAKQIAPKLHDQQERLQQETRAKHEAFLRAQREQQQWYQQQLQEMRQRINQRPHLFELVAQDNARMKAESKFDELITSAGLNVEEFISDEPQTMMSTMPTR